IKPIKFVATISVCLTAFKAFIPSPTLSIFFYTATPTPQLYTLSLHDALPISPVKRERQIPMSAEQRKLWGIEQLNVVRSDIPAVDRKSTRLNSSHVSISYAVFCLKKKKK